MLVCNYCGRNLKNRYESCPGCGSNSFQERASIGECVITTPPQDGYHVDLTNYYKEKKIANIFKWIGIIFLIIVLLGVLPFIVIGFILPFGVESEVAGEAAQVSVMMIVFAVAILVPSAAIPIGFIIGGRHFKKKADAEADRVEKLSKTGILIKNLPYEQVPTGTIINGREIYALKVHYRDQTGNEKFLISNPKYDNVTYNPSGTADLLLDPNNADNYFIDLEIF